MGFIDNRVAKVIKKPEPFIQKTISVLAHNNKLMHYAVLACEGRTTLCEGRHALSTAIVASIVGDDLNGVYYHDYTRLASDSKEITDVLSRYPKEQLAEMFKDIYSILSRQILLTGKNHETEYGIPTFYRYWGLVMTHNQPTPQQAYRTVPMRLGGLTNNEKLCMLSLLVMLRLFWDTKGKLNLDVFSEPTHFAHVALIWLGFYLEEACDYSLHYHDYRATEELT